MAKPRAIKQMSATDAAYIAGIIDGEGTISLTRRHRNENRQLEISICNTDMALLFFVKECIGAGRISSKRTYRPNHTAIATYSISNRQALQVIEQVHLYLRTYKAKRADLVLENYLKLTPRNGYYTPELTVLRNEFIRKFLHANPQYRHGHIAPIGSDNSVRDECASYLACSFKPTTTTEFVYCEPGPRVWPAVGGTLISARLNGGGHGEDCFGDRQGICHLHSGDGSQESFRIQHALSV